MRYLISLFILFNILVCCSGSIDNQILPHYKVYVDSSFTVNHKINIAAAFEEWNAKTNNLAQFNLEFAKYSKNEEVKNNTIYIVSKEMPSNILGEASWDQNIKYAHINISLGITDDKLFTAVVIHEIGHAMHLLHYKYNDPAIMHPTMGKSFHIECRDLLSFCNEWGCTVDCNPTISLDDNNPVRIQSVNSDNSECILIR